MRVRAIASATEVSNAVGQVQLECTGPGLVLAYLGVGSYADGYAPGALASGASTLVPWDRVLRARAGREHLELEVDPDVTPHHRLSLVRFSVGDGPPPHEVRRQRAILAIAGAGAALVTLTATALSVTRLVPGAGPLAGILSGLGAAGTTLLLVLLADRFAPWHGPPGDEVLGEFLAELRAYLPQVVEEGGPAPRPRPQAVLPDFERFLPRTTVAVAITLTAGLLTTLLAGKWLTTPTPRQAVASWSDAALPNPAANTLPDDVPASSRGTGPSPAPAPSAAAAPPAHPTPKPASGLTAPLGAPCECPRADSLLWQEPIPRLSTLVLSQRRRDRGGKARLALDVAAVNNGQKPIVELSLLVNFMEEDPPPSSKRFVRTHRALYFKGPLEPGAAIKWSVEARGTAAEVVSPIQEQLDPVGELAAPTNLIADLLRANHRPVRLHGARLLAFLGDARARPAVLALKDALRAEEAPYLQRLVEATAPLRSCWWRDAAGVNGRTISACVHNAGASPVPTPNVRFRGLEGAPAPEVPTAPPPTVVLEKTWQLAGTIPAGEGRKVKLSLGSGAPAYGAFELVVEP